jgi:hypothetical protein
LIAVHPVAEIGMNDDWSFIRTARDTAETGMLRYNGWSAPLIGPLAWWGALFVRCLGFSFTAVRLSGWLLVFGLIPLVWKFQRMLGLSEVQSLLSVSAWLLSPLILPNFATFMTDTPALLLYLVCVCAALRAWESLDNSVARYWLSITAIAGATTGSIRQVYWIGAVWCLLIISVGRSSGWRKRLFGWGFSAALIVFAYWAHAWLSQQPFVPADEVIDGLRALSWSEILVRCATAFSRYLISWALLSLPLTFLFVGRLREFTWKLHLLMISTAVLLTAFSPRPFPWLYNTITVNGILPSNLVTLGEKPTLISPLACELLTFVAILSGLYTCSVFYSLLRQHFRTGRQVLNTKLGRLSLLVIPFLLVYTGLIIVRAPVFGIYDRYLIPVLAVWSMITLLVYRALRGDATPGRIVFAVTTIYALYAIATAHDFFAEARAKVEAANTLVQSGIKRSDVLAGFEYDAWTETDLTGHINSDLVSGYQDANDCNGPDEWQVWWRPHTPHIHARFVLTLTPLGQQPKPIRNVEFTRWLPPMTERIFIQPSSEPLSCKPEQP